MFSTRLLRFKMPKRFRESQAFTAFSAVWSRLYSWEKWTLSVGPSVLLVFILVSVVDWRFTASERTLYDTLSSVQRKRVDSAMRHRLPFADDHLLAKGMGTQLLLYVPESYLGKKVRFQLEAKPYQAVGYPRGSVNLTRVPTERLFVVPRSELLMSKLLEGEFHVFVDCEGCPGPVLAGSFPFYRSNRKTLKQQIANYRSALENQAKQEAVEVAELNDVFLLHFRRFREAVGMLGSQQGSRQRGVWSLYNEDWQHDQARLARTFVRLESDQMRSQFVYPSLYLKLRELRQKLWAFKAVAEQVYQDPTPMNFAKAEKMAEALQERFGHMNSHMNAVVENFQTEMSRK